MIPFRCDQGAQFLDAVALVFVHREPAVFQHAAYRVCSMSNTAEDNCCISGVVTAGYVNPDGSTGSIAWPLGVRGIMEADREKGTLWRIASAKVRSMDIPSRVHQLRWSLASYARFAMT